ncbi:glycosyltransferase 87 family protein [Aequorivita sp. F47161]|uniref:Glycosyltransferase 87 family protein n=1 Tax=Aequorivita vitellina TaxID=2874475 RepID=A0A9X1QVJ6_9FLAO|nr:glycosyltransferase 87 family protein [Aequorivita vitellina]MCG2418584.1 glycosyltransferase 87 family protein [Aequorivita vitellina]
MDFIKRYKIPLLFSIIAIVFYISFGYHLERNDFTKLILRYGALFIIAYLFIEKFKLNFWFLASLGIVFRLIFIPGIPNLSQDFYRFLWDGRLLIQGVSPYLFTPDSSAILNNSVEQSQQLINGMGALNASHFSNYPPINQLFFTIAALFAGKSILGSAIVLRVLIIFADVGILYFGSKILKKFNLPFRNIFWYFLNPFIIIELTGNLHFEGVMLFFYVWALYLLFNGKWFRAAVLIGVSVSVKLLPLLFLPVFLKYFSTPKLNKSSQVAKTCEDSTINFRKLFKFYFIVGLTVIVTFLPFVSSEFINNFTSTIGLWFQNFEFNGSVYYIIRWIGFQVVGWNIIETVGKVLPIIVLLFVLGLAFFRKNKTPKQLITAMLFAVSFYFLLSTTVHPWYIATPLLLSVFTRYKFPIIWSFVVMLSYSAYGKNGFDEKLWLVALEYTVVIIVAFWEISTSKYLFLKPRHNGIKNS